MENASIDSDIVSFSKTHNVNLYWNYIPQDSCPPPHSILRIAYDTDSYSTLMPYVTFTHYSTLFS